MAKGGVPKSLVLFKQPPHYVMLHATPPPAKGNEHLTVDGIGALVGGLETAKKLNLASVLNSKLSHTMLAPHHSMVRTTHKASQPCELRNSLPSSLVIANGCRKFGRVVAPE